MHADQQRQRRQRDEQRPDARSEPWAELELTVPNDRSPESIVALVECVLVELTHEEVGAEYVSSNVWGSKRTQFTAADDVGETFRKRHYDERLGWHESIVSRESVREELINRLTRSTSLVTNRTHAAAVDEADMFSVMPTAELRGEPGVSDC